MKELLLVGDVRERLKELPDRSVHCCVTSPPYWGLRDYGEAGQIGLEQSPEEYVAELVAVFREVWRVLRDDGTLWLNLGDSYAGSGKGGNPPDSKWSGFVGNKSRESAAKASRPIIPSGLKPKDLVGIPFRVAFALQSDGWYLRQDIIWHKPNPMPESVSDRCTKSHEYIFLLTKESKYFFDHHAIEEDAKTKAGATWTERKAAGATAGNVIVGHETRNGTQRVVHGKGVTSNLTRQDGKRNKRSVWSVPVRPFRDAHFATFPTTLIEPCILAGTSAHGVCVVCAKPYERLMINGDIPERKTRDKTLGAYPDRKTTSRLNSVDMVAIPKMQDGWQKMCSCESNETMPAIVLDPFFGAGTTGLVAQSLKRGWVGCELNPVYAEMALKRIKDNEPEPQLFDYLPCNTPEP